MLMIVIGVIGISLSSIFVRYAQAPSAVTAAWRLLWTVVLMTPVVLGKASVRKEFARAGKGAIALHGKMIDAPIVARAQRTIDMARALGMERGN